MLYQNQNKSTPHVQSKIRSLQTLYLRSLLGDCYVDMNEIALLHTSAPIKFDININNQNFSKSKKSKDIKTIEEEFCLIHKMILNCKMCNISKMVKDRERFVGFFPTNYKHNNLPKIALIVEILRLQNIDNNIMFNNSINNLEDNKNNRMLLKIIESFNSCQANVFVLSLFKCVEIGTNQMITTQTYTQSLSHEGKICKNYLLLQLEHMDYAVFFGQHLCSLFFRYSLCEVSGRLLEYYTSNNKKIISICVPDISQMIANPTLKKEATIDIALLKNAMKL